MNQQASGKQSRGTGSSVRQGIVGLVCLILVVLGDWAQAQEEPAVPRPHPGLPSLPELRERPPSPPPGMRLPPIPSPAPSEKSQPLYLPRIFVRQIRVSGSTVFTAQELAAVTSPYENRMLTAEDLEELRLALTRLYIDHGYVTSGAILPDQTVTAGVVTFHVVEGELARIEVAGNRWFRTRYIRRRLALGAQPPVQIASLQERLQLLQQDDRIERLHAELTPGVQRGESELHVRVVETLPFRALLGFNNYQSPTVGGERGFMSLSYLNLTGHGDILSATLWLGSELEPQIDASYTLPLTSRNTALTLYYRRGETVVVEEPFEALDIETVSDAFGFTLRQPLYRTLRHELAVELTGEREHSETSLLGEPFPFTSGAEDGEFTIVPLRLTLEWIDRTPNQVLAARSRFSLGINALDATISDSPAFPDGRFQSWLGQFQWVKRFGPWDLQTLFRLDVQLATDALLPLEQLAVGGRYSVRGYRENQLVRDSGLVVALETRIPVAQHPPWADVIELALFADMGHAWNVDLPTPDPRTIASIGVGLRWAATIPAPIRLRPQCEIYWGYRLIDVDTPKDDVQDLGLHFQFVVAAF